MQEASYWKHNQTYFSKVLCTSEKLVFCSCRVKSNATFLCAVPFLQRLLRDLVVSSFAPESLKSSQLTNHNLTVTRYYSKPQLTKSVSLSGNTSLIMWCNQTRFLCIPHLSLLSFIEIFMAASGISREMWIIK